MTRKPLAELLTGQPGLPDVEGTIDAVLRDADGNILQHVHQHNMITEYFRLLFVPNGDWNHSPLIVFINETTEAMHPKRNSMRTTMPGVSLMAVSPSIDGVNRIWTYQTVFAVPPVQRTIRMIGLTRYASQDGFTNLKSGPGGICAATLLSTPIVQPTSATLEVSYRLAIQRT
jgi:hypothetical protein